jgi:hypothetical protein
MMDKFGYTEREARVAMHLDRAEALLTELARENNPGSDLGHIIWKETHIREHIRALRRELGMFVLYRDYPQGWGYIPPKDNEMED